MGSRKIRKTQSFQVVAIPRSEAIKGTCKIIMLRVYLPSQLNNPDFSSVISWHNFFFFFDKLVAMDKTDSLALINLL